MISEGVILAKNGKEAILRKDHHFKPITEDGKTIKDLLIEIVPTRESGEYMTSVKAQKLLADQGFIYTVKRMRWFLGRVHNGKFLDRLSNGKYVLSVKGAKIRAESLKV